MINTNTLLIPLFCPRESCKYFLSPTEDPWYHRDGFHKTKAHGKVPRFLCKNCGKTCSTQTFVLDYWTQKRLDWELLESILSSGSSDRGLARAFKVTPTAIQNRINRLAKVHLSSHSDLIRSVLLKENVTADGFETFSGSQYNPCHISILMGSDSQTAYAWSYGPLRRKGRMTEAQKRSRKEREKKWKPPRRALETSFVDGILRPLIQLRRTPEKSQITLITDEHPVYQRSTQKAFKVLNPDNSFSYEHIRVSSRAYRDVKNPLFPSNYIDREIRKDLANHHRETTTYARNPNDMMNRLSIHLSRHNMVKRYRENNPRKDLTTHWEMAGLERGKLNTTMMKLHILRPLRNPKELNISMKELWDRGIDGPLGITKRRPQARFWSLSRET